ncbi:MAG: ABC transporter ATP-binding protein [Candidatus Methanoplasma sp.]|jgi:NitT/TauT family transport system ATP-binding protein|nr:ABC transporter ATP-binding protein [Candidatus Methanoplasma sp.]
MTEGCTEYSYNKTGCAGADPQIKIDRLEKTYRRDGKKTEAIEDISLDIRQGELVTFIGPSGCGKTTLLKLIAGLITPNGGTVEINGRPCTQPGADRGMVFQDFALLPWRSVRKNVELGLEIAGVPRAERREKAESYIRLVGLERFADSKTYELSGGMKQRVAIARALVVRPDVVLMDEPFGALDAQTRNIMQAQLTDILGSTDQTIIFITHSVDEAIYISDRIVVLTKRPTAIREVINIPWARPRDRSSSEFNALKKRILDYLERENVMDS